MAAGPPTTFRSSRHLGSDVQHLQVSGSSLLLSRKEYRKLTGTCHEQLHQHVHYQAQEARCTARLGSVSSVRAEAWWSTAKFLSLSTDCRAGALSVAVSREAGRRRGWASARLAWCHFAQRRHTTRVKQSFRNSFIQFEVAVTVMCSCKAELSVPCMMTK